MYRFNPFLSGFEQLIMERGHLFAGIITELLQRAIFFVGNDFAFLILKGDLVPDHRLFVVVVYMFLELEKAKYVKVIQQWQKVLSQVLPWVLKQVDEEPLGLQLLCHNRKPSNGVANHI